MFDERDFFFPKSEGFNVPPEVIAIDEEGRTRRLRRSFRPGATRVTLEQEFGPPPAPRTNSLPEAHPQECAINVMDGEGRVYTSDLELPPIALPTDRSSAR